jgi:hypothetical protein
VEFNKNRFPAKDFGYDDQKRLRREFHTDNLYLLWNQVTKRCEVWYRDVGQCYIVSVIQHPYNICRVIKDMKHRERSMNDVFHDYLRGEEEYKENKRKNIRSIAEECAKGVEAYHKQRISVRV